MYHKMLDPEELSSLTKENVLGAVKGCFLEILVQLKETGGDDAVKEYFNWLQTSVNGSNAQNDQNSSTLCEKSQLLENFDSSKIMYETHIEKICKIRQDIKSMLLESNIKILPQINDDDESEVVDEQKRKKKKKKKSTIYINQMLCHDVNEALHSVYKCQDCHSTSVIPRPLVSHSASVESLIQLFLFYVPHDLTNYKLLDIGSGMGSILFGAYYFSKAKEICGVELNPDLFAVLNSLVLKYKLNDRVSVINGDIQDYGNLLNSFDVVTFNNVFEYFVSIETQKKIWLFMRQNLKTNSIFITNPDIYTLLQPLNLKFENWLVSLEQTNSPSTIDKTFLKGFQETDEKFHVYKVINGFNKG